MTIRANSKFGEEVNFYGSIKIRDKASNFKGPL